jgi:hypothetical protein
MSKSNDPSNENKVIPKAYGNMSSRQQIIYIKNKTQKETEWTIDKDFRCHDDEKIEEPVDSHQVYLEQKEKFVKLYLIQRESLFLNIFSMKGINILNKAIKNSLSYAKTSTSIVKNIPLLMRMLSFVHAKNPHLKEMRRTIILKIELTLILVSLVEKLVLTVWFLGNA